VVVGDVLRRRAALAALGTSPVDPANTVIGAIYGGVMGGPVQPFSMELNRPFVYLVRERFTDALLFAGVVVDPSLK
jgi:serine protease inhibitor